MLLLHDVVKIGRFLITLVAALEGVELFCTIVSDTDTGMLIPPQVPLSSIFTGA
jgi:hypothetical protein